MLCLPGPQTMLCLPGPPIRLALPWPAINPMEHQGLVAWVANEFVDTGIPFDDLVDEGQVGLLNAIRLYDRRRGVAFSTYATPSIRSTIRRAIHNHVGLIHIPEDLRLAIRRGETPEDSTLGWERRECLRDAMEVMGHECLGGDTTDWVVDPFDDGDSGEFDARTPLGLLCRRMLPMVEALPGRWCDVVKMRFGFDGLVPMLQSDVALAVGLSKQRIQQIEKQAIKRLRAEFLALLEREGVGDGIFQEAMRAAGHQPPVPEKKPRRARQRTVAVA